MAQNPAHRGGVGGSGAKGGCCSPAVARKNPKPEIPRLTDEDLPVRNFEQKEGDVSSSNLARWGALGALLAGLGFVAAAYIAWLAGGQNLQALRVSNIALMVASIGAAGGVVGLRVRQGAHHGRGRLVGTAGFAVALVGSALPAVGVALGFLVGSGVLEGVAAARVVGMGVLGTRLGLALLGVGLALLGVAALRAKVLPRWVGVVLVGAFPASATIWVFLSTFSGIVVFGFAWLALSYALWSEPRGEAA